MFLEGPPHPPMLRGPIPNRFPSYPPPPLYHYPPPLPMFYGPQSQFYPPMPHPQQQQMPDSYIQHQQFIRGPKPPPQATPIRAPNLNPSARTFTPLQVSG